MKKYFNDFLSSIKYEYLEKISLLLLSFWAIIPIVEYYVKNNLYRFGDLYWTNGIYLIGIMGIIIYLIYLGKQIKDDNVTFKKYLPELLIIVLLIISVIASICSDDPHLSFYGEHYRKEGLIVYIMYIGFMLTASTIKNKKYFKIIARIIIFSTLVITILPLFNKGFSFTNYTNIFYNRNHYGYYLMISLMLAIFMFVDNNGFRRFFYSIAYIFLLYILILNDTFGCYLAMVISLLFFVVYSFIKKNKRIIASTTIIIFALVSFFVSYYGIKWGERVDFTSTKGIIWNNISGLFRDTKTILDDESTEDEIAQVGSLRGVLWKEAINYTLDHPLLGGGMECLNTVYAKCELCNSDRPHNAILQFSSFIGIPGAIVYIIFIVLVALQGLKKIKSDSIYMMVYFTAMCYFISSMFGNSMFYTSPYFMIFLGLLIGINRRKEKET